MVTFMSLPVNTVSAVTLPKVTTATLKTYIDSLTLKQKIGQLFIVRASADSAQTRVDAQTYALGGIILFGRDFTGETRASMTKKIGLMQSGTKVPRFVATDQEGGTVSRLSASAAIKGNLSLPSPQQSLANGGTKQLVADTKQSAALLKQLGINWNFAPIADVTKDNSSFIYDRTMGKNYKQTAALMKRLIPAMQANGVAATLKHFPGYGAAVDTHTTFTTVDRTLKQLETEDMVPFKAGIDAGADAVMVTHIVMTALDKKNPASLSPRVVQYLRQQMGFNGVIITDDLAMDAVQHFATQQGIQSVDVAAVEAGMDAIIADDYQTGIPAIEAAVRSGKISERQIDASILRLLKLKQRLGLITPEVVNVPHVTVQKPVIKNNKIILHGRVCAREAQAGQRVVAGNQGKQVTARINAAGKFTLTFAGMTRQQQVTVKVADKNVPAKTVTLPSVVKKTSGQHETTHTLTYVLIGAVAAVLGIVGIIWWRQSQRRRF